MAKCILSFYCGGRRWEKLSTAVINLVQLSRFPCVHRGYNACSPLRMIQVSKECLDENYTREEEDLSSQVKYQVNGMMLMFKKKTSDLLQFSFTDPLRNALWGSSDYHWKLQALSYDGDDILNLCFKYFLFAKELQVFPIDSSELDSLHAYTSIQNFWSLSILCPKFSYTHKFLILAASLTRVYPRDCTQVLN